MHHRHIMSMVYIVYAMMVVCKCAVAGPGLYLGGISINIRLKTNREQSERGKKEKI